MNDETNKGGKKKVREETEGFQGGKEIKKKEEKKKRKVLRDGLIKISSRNNGRPSVNSLLNRP